MVELAPPSTPLIDRLTTEVGFGERLVAYKVLASAGGSRLSLYSFEDVVDFLDPPRSGEKLLVRGGHAYLPGIEPSHLHRWIRDVMGDTELAAALEEHAQDGEGFALRLGPMRELLRQRWAQVIAARSGAERGRPARQLAPANT